MRKSCNTVVITVPFVEVPPVNEWQITDSTFVNESKPKQKFDPKLLIPLISFVPAIWKGLKKLFRRK